MSLVVRTLSEQIFNLVRERIASGAVPSDQAIRQDALANELGVSKIPLREALARLEQEGLLTSHANRGFFLRAMTAAEAEEIFALRRKIEPDAVAAASLAATDDDRAFAAGALEALDFAASNNLSEVPALNRAFHMALVRPSRRLLTAQLVERLHFMSERYVHKHLEPAGREDRAHVEHQTLLAVWTAGDGERAAALVSVHIQATLDDLRLQLKNQT